MDSESLYQLFQELADLPSAQQKNRLADIRQGNAALADELGSLLEAYQSAADFLEEPLQIELVDSGEGLYVGRLLGAYRIDRLIARGGMGMVFLAHRDDGTYDRRVAVKLVDIAVADSNAVAQFHRERDILATLDHPNIASVIDGGITSDGQPYLVMPFVDGQAINRYVEQTAPDRKRRIELFLTVCRAVSHAHRNLVVHRDLKPGNILVDEQGHVTLLDFGIAKVMAEDSGERTQTTSRKYTPLYAAPEQLSGGKVTTATDVYSLGVILNELLTGILPAQAKPKASPTRSGALDADLRTIIDTCLEETPERRYASVDALAADLQRYMDNRPIEARPASWGYRAAKFLRRNSRTAAAVAALAVLAIVYVATVFYQNRAISAERDRALLEQQKSAQIADFLQSILGAADPAASGRDVTVSDLLSQAMERIDGELDGQPDLQASLLSVLASTYSNLGDQENAEASITRAIKIREQLYGPNRPETAALYRMAGNIADRAGMYDDALAYHGKAVEAFRHEPGPDSIEYAMAAYFLGATHLALGQWTEAESLNREAVSIYGRAANTDTVQWASALNNLAMGLGMQERFAEAVPAHQRALDLMKEVYGDVHVDVASTLYNIGGVLEAQGKRDEALPYYEQALEMRRPLLGNDHPMVIINLSTLASLHQAFGDPVRGLPYVEEAVATAHRTLPDPHPLTAYAMNVYGSVLADIPDRVRECETPLREAYRIRQAVLPEGHWTIASTQGGLGICLLRNGKRSEAESLLSASLETMKAQFGPDHARTVQAEGRLSELGVDSLQ